MLRADERQPRDPHDAPPNDERPRILWAGGDADTRERARQLLAPSYDVYVAADGGTALRIARTRRPSLVLGATAMPGMGGLELRRRLRADPATRDVPFILVTGHVTGKDDDDGPQAAESDDGADDYLATPFSARELLARVGTHVELARVRGESDRRVIRILEGISEACAVLSADWRIVYLNPAARESLAAHDIDHESVVGRSVWEQVAPEATDAAAVRQLRQAMVERDAIAFGHHDVPHDRWYDVRLDPLLDGGLACFFRDVTAERRQQEDHRRIARERDDVVAHLHVQLARMPIGYIAFDLLCRIVDWNPAAEAIFGHRRDEVLGRDGPDVLLSPADRPALADVIARLAAGDMDAHSLNENVTKDGRTIICEWHNTPLRDATGEVIALLSMVQDVTERVRAEAALRDSERSLAVELAAMTHLQEVSTRLVRADDATSLLEDIVAAAMAITGADKGTIQFLDRRDGTPTIVASVGFGAEFLDFLRSTQGMHAACNTEAITSGARVIVADVAASPLYAEAGARDATLAAGVRAVQSTPLVARSGRLVGVLSTHYAQPRRPAARDLRVLDLLARQAADWIERTHAEETARESEERYRALVSQVRDYAIFSTDERGVITTWNEGCLHVLGYTEAEFVGSNAAALFPPEDDPAGTLESHMGRIAEEHAISDERWLLAKGGRRFYAMGAGTPLRDAGGRLIGFSVVLRDVTRMKLAQDEVADRGEHLARLVDERTDALEQATERLRISERMASLGTLAAGLGHDLGNLLLPLDARLRALDRADLRPELRAHVAGISSCVRYLEQLSGGLRLLATHPGDSRFTEPTELGAWWRDIAAVLRNVLPHGVTFDSVVPPSETWVSMGGVGLTQAVFNLVQNAADALRPRGSGRVVVAIEPGPAPSTIAVRVSDDGPGMTPEVLRRCTEPYFTTKVRGISTGTGLALVHGLVTGAGGHVDITSSVGAGTSVRLVLPGAMLPERPAGTGPPPRRPRRKRRSR
jgi:PAS domain S-box-containing protein